LGREERTFVRGSMLDRWVSEVTKHGGFCLRVGPLGAAVVDDGEVVGLGVAGQEV
jgi:hypothetical protein